MIDVENQNKMFMFELQKKKRIMKNNQKKHRNK